MSSSTDESSSSNISGSFQDTDTKYKKIQLELPDDLTDVPTKQFDDLVQISTPHLFSIGEDYFSYAVDTTFYRDDPDLKVYKCDISSGEVVELTGIMPNWNSSSGRYAVCGDNVYMFYETLADRILVNLDFRDNKVDILKKEVIDFGKDSFYWSFPISQTEYAVNWFDMAQDILTNHMILVDESGEETELFTDKNDFNKIHTHIDVAEDKIYRSFHTKATNEVNLSVYDLSGTLVEQNYLPEITSYMNAMPSPPHVRRITAAGSCVAITFCEYSPYFITYIYNLEENTYIALEDVYVIDNLSKSFNGFVLVSNSAGSNGSSTQDLFVLKNDSNSVYKIAGDLDITIDTITNGEKIVYWNDNSLFLCDISQL